MTSQEEVIARLKKFTEDVESISGRTALPEPILERLADMGYRITTICVGCPRDGVEREVRQCPNCKTFWCVACYGDDAEEGDQCAACEYPE